MKTAAWAIAALALALGLLPGVARAGAGWYLILPPVAQKEKEGQWGPVSAPLGQWEHLGAYDTAAECESTRAREGEAAARRLDARQPRPADPFNSSSIIVARDAQIAFNGRCIASDDPRLR